MTKTSAASRLAERNDLLSVLRQVDSELSKLKESLDMEPVRRLYELSEIRDGLSFELENLGFHAPQEPF